MHETRKTPKNFNVLDNEFKTERNLAVLTFGTLSLILAISLLVVLSTRKYAIYQSSPSLTDSLSVESVCFNGFHGITKRAAISDFVTDRYKSFLESINYAPVDLKPDRSDYRLVRKHGKDKCKIVIATSTKNERNLRAFMISLEKDHDFIFDFKVSEVSEILLTDSDIKEAR